MFKHLCLQWSDSDSISEKEQLAEQIEKLGREFLDKQIAVREKYHMDHIIPEHLKDRGSVYLKGVTLDRDYVYTKYDSDLPKGMYYDEDVHLKIVEKEVQ